MSAYITYTHVDSEIDTISEFLDQQGLSIVRGMTVTELLNYRDDDGISNLQRVWASYSPQQQQQYEQQYLAGTLDYLAVGTILALPKSRLFREVAAIVGSNQVVTGSYNTFWGDQYAKLITSPQYSSAIQTFGTHIHQKSQDIGVWLWSRALYVRTGWHDILNLSRFIESCTINVDGNGGSWSITMCAVDVTIDATNVELTSSIDSISQFFTQNRNHTVRVPLQDKLISPNDVVWISLEKLLIEGDDRIQLQNELIISPSQLPSTQSTTRIYDMIGLVDRVSCHTDSNGQISVTIMGKDLSKLLIDDGAFAYPLQFAQRAFIQPNNRLIERLAATGSYILQSALAFRSIRFTMQYIFNHLVNLGVVPDDLLSAYVNRVEVLRIGDEVGLGNDRIKQLDSSLQQLRSAIIDSGISQTQAPIIASQIIDFFSAGYDQNVFVRSPGGLISGYSDWSYGGVSVTANTTPSFLRSQGIVLFRRTVGLVDGQSFSTFSNSYVNPNKIFNAAYAYVAVSRLSAASSNIQSTLAKGLWQIIQLIIDPNVADRRIADPSISHPDGSLLSHLWKVCQQPFVELLFDTYGDRYAIIVRQPPLTQSAISQLLDGRIHTQDDVLVGDSVIIEISNETVMQIALDFDDEVYSMYEITPQGAFLGQGSEVALAYVPIIVFPQYADIWGVKRKQIQSNYISYQGITQAGTGKNYIAQQIGEDLAFVLETHAHLPFTRKGTLTIRGDRRIKVGSWIRIISTGELAYVEAVSNSRQISKSNIDAVTSIRVRCAMKEEFVRGKNVDGVVVSYFNIVDLRAVKQYIVDNLISGTRESVQLERSFGVNQQVFDFFVAKRQLE